MLSQLYIENIAVIEKASIDFHAGFNVLTGETGAGKSIVIDAINAILGERTSREIVRNGARAAFVSAVFDSLNARAAEKLKEFGYSLEEDGSLLIQREISLDGKGSCKINGRPATVSVLKELGVFLINILGQHESYHLLSADLHVRYLDKMGALGGKLREYQNSYQEMQKIQDELASFQMDESQKARRIDLLSYQIGELENAGLRAGEQAELTELRTMYQNSEKIAFSAAQAREAFNGDENNTGAVAAVISAADALADAGRYLPAAAQLSERIRGLAYDLEDCNEELRDFASRLEYDPAELERIEERLDVIYRLSIKYGETEEEMLSYLEQCREELKNIELSDETVSKLTQKLEETEKETKRLAGELSAGRSKAAQEFTKLVKEELRFLDMPGVDFQVEQEACPFNALGCDKIQFLISTNPGEPAKPIAKIASGGELSRIMLAIKTVLSGQDEIDTLIFDEVDTGISGSAAQKVGMKLREVAKDRQVICVTHLAQIASLADSHFLIQKQTKKEKTYTEVSPLDFEGRKHELARIMGGAEITELMLQNAEEMLRMAGIAPK